MARFDCPRCDKSVWDGTHDIAIFPSSQAFTPHPPTTKYKNQR